MTALTKFDCFALDCGSGKHNLASDSLKVLLTNVAPVSTNAVVGDLTDISAGNGYSAGGLTIAVTSFLQSAGVAKLILANSALLTASGGTVGPFRYCAVYNFTATAKNLIGWADYGSALTLAIGQQFQLQPNATTGILTIT